MDPILDPICETTLEKKILTHSIEFFFRELCRVSIKSGHIASTFQMIENILKMSTE